MLFSMGAPFKVTARAERASVSPGKSTLWAALRIEATGPALEAKRAPLAVALVVDTSTSMRGDPIAHAVRSCELLADLLEPDDRLAIVGFAKRAGVLCGLTSLDAAGRAQIAAAVRAVETSGGTNMYGGLAAAAGMLMTAPAGLRRVIVVLSDGQPNVGIASATGLAAFVHTLRPIGVSTLGLGRHHDEDVLHAIAVAGSGRYAYLPDPLAARLDLARAALAHGGVVADQLELKIKLGDGVELVRLLPPTALRHGGSGVTAAIGDVFVDEARTLAIELALDIAPGATGELAQIAVTGRGLDDRGVPPGGSVAEGRRGLIDDRGVPPGGSVAEGRRGLIGDRGVAPGGLIDGAVHEVQVALAVDVHAGPHAIERDAQRGVVLVRAEAARAEARAQADRGGMAAAAAVLREMVAAADVSDGFVHNDGTPLAELREQLRDEVLGYEQGNLNGHHRKAAFDYYSGPNRRPNADRQGVPAPGQLRRLDGPNAGDLHRLMTETIIGRSRDNDLMIEDPAISRHHARIVYLDDRFVLYDLGSRTGCKVNRDDVQVAQLEDGDIVELASFEFRFELLS
jgi:Ca-activated chloride channel family protein